MNQQLKQQRMERLEELRRQSNEKIKGPLGNLLAKSFDFISKFIDEGATSLGYAMEAFTMDRALAYKYEKEKTDPLRHIIYELGRAIGMIAEVFVEEQTTTTVAAAAPNAAAAAAVAAANAAEAIRRAQLRTQQLADLNNLRSQSTTKVQRPLGHLLAKTFEFISTIVNDGLRDAAGVSYALESFSNDRAVAYRHDKEKADPLRQLVYDLIEAVGTLIESIMEEQDAGAAGGAAAAVPVAADDGMSHHESFVADSFLDFSVKEEQMDYDDSAPSNSAIIAPDEPQDSSSAILKEVQQTSLLQKRTTMDEASSEPLPTKRIREDTPATPPQSNVIEDQMSESQNNEKKKMSKTRTKQTADVKKEKSIWDEDSDSDEESSVEETENSKTNRRSSAVSGTPSAKTADWDGTSCRVCTMWISKAKLAQHMKKVHSRSKPRVSNVSALYSSDRSSSSDDDSDDEKKKKKKKKEKKNRKGEKKSNSDRSTEEQQLGVRCEICKVRLAFDKVLHHMDTVHPDTGKDRKQEKDAPSTPSAVKRLAPIFMPVNRANPFFVKSPKTPQSARKVVTATPTSYPAAISTVATPSIKPITKDELQCKDCNRLFETPNGLSAHVRRAHWGVKCEVCKMQFAEEKIDQHMEKSHPDTPWDKNRKNKKEESTSAAAASAAGVVAAAAPTSTPVAAASRIAPIFNRPTGSSNTPSLLRTPVVKVELGSPPASPMTRAVVTADVKPTVASLGAGEMLKCNKCTRTFTSQRGLNNHAQQHWGVQCSYCKMRVSKDKYIEHMEKMHPDKPADLPKVEEIVIKDVEGTTAAAAANTPIPPKGASSTTPATVPSPKPAEFKCTKCSRVFDSQRGLIHHGHSHFGVQCPYCKMRVAESKLQEHLEKNHPDKPEAKKEQNEKNRASPEI